MYEGGNENPRTMGETYAVAAGASSMKMEPHKFSSADVIAAAGMNAHRTGLALRRLVTEWESGATPPQVSPPSVKDIKRARGVDTSVAEAEHRRLMARCTKWAYQENMLRFQRMKSLPQIRAGLVFYVRDKGWEDAEHLVAAVLRRFLSPVCPVCMGRGKHVIEGTARVGRECGGRDGCGGSGVVKVPYGRRGELLLEHITACVGQSMKELTQGAYSLTRRAEDVERRAKHRGELSQAERRKVDAEVRADSLQDTEAVAERFRCWLELGRKAGTN